MFNGYNTRNLVASRSFPYGGKQLKPGDAFEATAVDAEYLIRTKRATSLEDDEVQIVSTDSFLTQATDAPVVSTPQAPTIPVEVVQDLYQEHEQDLKAEEQPHPQAENPSTEEKPSVDVLPVKRPRLRSRGALAAAEDSAEEKE